MMFTQIDGPGALKSCRPQPVVDAGELMGGPFETGLKRAGRGETRSGTPARPLPTPQTSHFFIFHCLTINVCYFRDMAEKLESPVAGPKAVKKAKGVKKMHSRILCSWSKDPEEPCEFEGADEAQMIAHIRHAHKGVEFEDEGEEEGEDEPLRIETAAEVAAKKRKEREAKRVDPPGVEKVVAPPEFLPKPKAAPGEVVDTSAESLKRIGDVLYLLSKLNQAGVPLSAEQKGFMSITANLL